MPTPIKMPALSPTMEEGTLSRWLVKVGDNVQSGDIMAEIETDKATMEFEAVDEGTIVDIAVPEGTEGVKVGAVIATLAGEDEDPAEAKAATENTDQESEEQPVPSSAQPQSNRNPEPQKPAQKEKSDTPAGSTQSNESDPGDRIIASPLAKRIAEQNGIDLETLKGSGPNGRIVKADVESAGTQIDQAKQQAAIPTSEPAPAPKPSEPSAIPDYGIPYEAEKLSNIRKTIARRLTEAKRDVPHYYLTIDVNLDPLLVLRKQLNTTLEADGVKLSVNDLLIKALAKALIRVPQCNVGFAGTELRKFSRADISVAVAAPSGLITPIIVDAGSKAVSSISTEMKSLVDKAKDGKLQPQEYQGGTASLSNLGMFGIKQFDAVINPPQAMIMAVGAGEPRPYVIDGALQIATVMSASGSFDHRAIDGADGAQLMQAFKELCEAPLGLVA